MSKAWRLPMLSSARRETRNAREQSITTYVTRGRLQLEMEVSTFSRAGDGKGFPEEVKLMSLVLWKPVQEMRAASSQLPDSPQTSSPKSGFPS